jgi:hypothetical protein
LALSMVKMTIATVVQNEAAYIREWMAYHRVRGVRRFIIYDNNSTDSLRETLAPLIATGQVVLEKVSGICYMAGLYPPHIKFPHNFRIQLQSVAHALFTYGPYTEYMALIDVDEFMDAPTASVVPQVRSKKPLYSLKLPWTLVWPLMRRGAQGEPLLSAHWFATQRKPKRNDWKGLVVMKTFLRDLPLVPSIHGLATLGFVDSRLRSIASPPPFHKLYHVWCRHSDCIRERTSRGYFSAAHNQTLSDRMADTKKGATIGTLLRWNFRVQKELRGGDPRRMDHVMLYGMGRSGTSITQYVLSPRRLAIFEPCRVFDTKKVNFALFNKEFSAKCLNLVKSLIDCAIPQSIFDKLKKSFSVHSRGTYRHWTNYGTWMRACWQNSLIIKEIRVLPTEQWRKLPLRFIYVRRNLAEVTDSQESIEARAGGARADHAIDHVKLAKTAKELQTTADAHGDPTLAYEDLFTGARALKRIASEIQLSASDIEAPLHSVKKLSGTHSFLAQQGLKQP